MRGRGPTPHLPDARAWIHWFAAAHSSSGLGHRPLTAAARVRIPYAPHRKTPGNPGVFSLSALSAKGAGKRLKVHERPKLGLAWDTETAPPSEMAARIGGVRVRTTGAAVARHGNGPRAGSNSRRAVECFHAARLLGAIVMERDCLAATRIGFWKVLQSRRPSRYWEMRRPATRRTGRRRARKDESRGTPRARCARVVDCGIRATRASPCVICSSRRSGPQDKAWARELRWPKMAGAGGGRSLNPPRRRSRPPLGIATSTTQGFCASGRVGWVAGAPTPRAWRVRRANGGA
jgi:hypothetical protein